jgi:hypothetical protein
MLRALPHPLGSTVPHNGIFYEQMVGALPLARLLEINT